MRFSPLSANDFAGGLTLFVIVFAAGFAVVFFTTAFFVIVLVIGRFATDFFTAGFFDAVFFITLFLTGLFFAIMGFFLTGMGASFCVLSHIWLMLCICRAKMV